MSDAEPTLTEAERAYWRLRTSFHEAGHAVAAVLLGRPLGLVTIRPGAAYSGLCQWTSARVTDADLDKIDRGPVPMMPARLRRVIETSVIVSLCGPLAAELAGPYNGTVPPDEAHDLDEAERLARGVADLSRPDRDRLAGLEADPEPLDPDEERAWRRASALDVDAPVHYLGWLRALARSLTCSPPFVRGAEALAPVLRERGVTGGRRARAIILDGIRGPALLEVAASPPLEGGSAR